MEGRPLFYVSTQKRFVEFFLGMKFPGCFFQAAVIFWAALLLASVASAQVRPETEAEACEDPDVHIDVRPNAGGPASWQNLGNGRGPRGT